MLAQRSASNLSAALNTFQTFMCCIENLRYMTLTSSL